MVWHNIPATPDWERCYAPAKLNSTLEHTYFKYLI